MVLRPILVVCLTVICRAATEPAATALLGK
jgi:hypothetical protein